MFARQIMIACDFYESGVVKRAWRRTSEYGYEQVEWFTYNLVRQYHNGVYAGTALSLTMKMDDGRTFSYRGTHKERKKGFIFKPRFEGDDEMDIVREAIEIHVAARIENEIIQNGETDWCGRAMLTPKGLIPRKGRKSANLVAWNEMGALWFKNGELAITTASEQKKPFVKIPTKGRNYYPCQRLFDRFAKKALGNEQAA